MKYTKLIFFLLLLVFPMGFTSALLGDDLVSYYKFDNTTGVLLDQLGINNGTNGGATRGDVGILNNSISFNGVTTANLSTNIGSGLNYSFNFWLNYTESGGDGTAQRLIDTTAGFDSYVQPSTNKVFYGAISLGTSTSALVLNNWSMITYTCDVSTNTSSLYINGLLDSSFSEDCKANLGSTLFLASTELGARKLAGKLDELGTWNKTLDPSEVTTLYNSGMAKSYPFIGTTLLYPLDLNIFQNSTITFNASYISSTSENLTNATQYIWYGNGTLFNQTTVNITGQTNTSSIPILLSSQGNFTWNSEVCYTSSVCEFAVSNSTFNVTNLEFLGEEFSSPAVSGTIQTFYINVSTLGAISLANLIYNNTSYNSSINQINSTFYELSSTLTTPITSSDINVSLFWTVELSDSSTFNSSASNQTLLNLGIDNCSTFTNQIFNMSLFDERTLLNISGTIEFNFDLLNLDNSQITELSSIAENIDNSLICSNVNLTNQNYLYDLELRYYSSPDNGSTYNYVPEFYHIQNSSTSSLPMAINLYDLNVNESTEFTIFYRDNNYIARDNVLLQILRKYVNEGVYRTIEIPITSSQGTAFGHFDLDNYKYQIIATENGVILNTFNNPTIRCESQLSGICEIFLNGQPSTPQSTQLTVEENFAYSLTTTNETITLDYVIPNGESRTVNVTMFQSSPFADSTLICSQELLSSSGSITCTIDATIGDSQVNVRLISEGIVKADFTVLFEEDLALGFALNNYFIGAMLLIIIVTMFISSPALMVLGAVFGVGYLGLIFLLKGSSVGLVLGALSWFLVSAIVILIKINKRAEG